MDSDSDSSIDHEEEMYEINQLAALDKEFAPIDTISLPSTVSQTTINSSAHHLQEIARIDSALALNKVLDDKYKKLENVLKQRLQECREKFKRNSELFRVQPRNEQFRYQSCGKPYFKDQLFFTPPDNADTILMKKSDMYDFSTLVTVPGWTVRDKNELINVLLEMSQAARKKELETKLVEIIKENNNASKHEVEQLQKEISLLKKKSLAELALPIEEEYDWETVANVLNRRHTPSEYRSLWRLFFHPSINKNHWTRTEHQELQRIAKEQNTQDWDLIAEELNTGRTGYQCFVYFRTNITSAFNGRRWTKEEVEYLKRIIDFYKQGNYIPWGKVATAMDNRTKIQVYNKYTRLTEQRKGRFLPEEDSVILSYIDVYGLDFKNMSQYLPGRSQLQLRTRYQILAKMATSSATWSIEDDRKLLQMMATQDSTANFSIVTKHFPGKDRMNIRSRYLTLAKWMKTHPHCDIELAPRRGTRRLAHGQVETNLKQAIENLKNRIQTEVNKTRGRKKITKKSSETEIEDAIVSFLVNESAQESEKTSTDCAVANQCAMQDSQLDKDSLYLLNLRHLLILLSSRLDKDKFLADKNVSAKYANLVEPKIEDNLVKVKSYSKKESVRVVQIGTGPTVWGDNRFLSPKYMLPPHLANITGCRVLMKHISTTCGEPNDINISLMMRRNCVFKDAMNMLKRRFTTLFLWPILLSNVAKKSDDTVEIMPTPNKRSRKLITMNELTSNASDGPTNAKRYKKAKQCKNK